jgi:dihydroneopterin aldolase
MMSHSLSITIEGIELRGRCGVTPEERAVGQTLVVDVRLEPAALGAGQSDDLGDTVDYGRLVDLVRGVVEGGEFHLLERLATVIADEIWEEFEPVLLEVAVTKPSPPVSTPVTAARVEVVRTS